MHTLDEEKSSDDKDRDHSAEEENCLSDTEDSGKGSFTAEEQVTPLLPPCGSQGLVPTVVISGDGDTYTCSSSSSSAYEEALRHLFFDTGTNINANENNDMYIQAVGPRACGSTSPIIGTSAVSEPLLGASRDAGVPVVVVVTEPDTRHGGE